MSYVLTKMTDIIEFNPRETIARKQVCKKVPMEYLQPFTRQISGFEEAPYAGGTKFRNNDTIMARITPCLENGKTAFVKGFAENEVVFGSTEYIVMRAIPGASDSVFIYYLATSPSFRDVAIKSMVGSSGRQRVQQDVLENLELVLPDYETQVRVGKVLSAFDDKIELNAQINHNLEEQLYALYASNYDNLSGKKVPLKECCSFQEGYVNPTQTKPEYFDGSVKWLRAVDINESFIISTSRTLTEQGFASAGKSALLFPKDSIAISKSGTIGRLGIVADNMCGNRAVINIVPKQKKWLAFIYCYLKSRQAEFSDLAVGSVQKNLYVSILEPLEIFSPADSVLNDFHFSAQTILEKMKNNCFEMQSLAQLRDALLPKLMSGEIDVSEVEV
jgi:type I restriction enzyme S subunit